MKKISTKQKLLLEAIDWYIGNYGYSPTIRELCEMMDNSSSATVFDKLEKLERNGYISTVPGKARTIKILKYD